MKYLIFGDVHGNLPALELLLKIEKNNYDILVSHGDVVNYGPWGNECVELLSTLSHTIKLKGNHELNFIKGIYPGNNVIAKTFFQFCYPRFYQIEKIKTYGEIVKLKNYTVTHTIENEYIYPDTDLSKYSLDKNYIIGHSHYQFDKTYDGNRIVNTGSVGQNRKIINVAEYVLYDDHNDLVQLKSFNFNINILIDQMKQDNYPKICLEYYQNKEKNEI